MTEVQQLKEQIATLRELREYDRKKIERLQEQISHLRLANKQLGLALKNRGEPLVEIIVDQWAKDAS